MDDDQTQVRVSCRSTTLAEATRMTVLPGEDRRVFVVLDLPPPVGTVLTVQGGEQSRTVEVTHVVEVPDADRGSARGFYAREAGEEALKRHGTVGSEGLGPAGEEGSQGDGESDDQGNRAPSGYAVPAPVVDPEAGSGDDEAGADSMVDGQIDQGAEEDPSAAPNRKRKKGRRRR